MIGIFKLITLYYLISNRTNSISINQIISIASITITTQGPIEITTDESIRTTIPEVIRTLTQESVKRYNENVLTTSEVPYFLTLNNSHKTTSKKITFEIVTLFS